MKKTFLLNILFLFFSACVDPDDGGKKINNENCREGETIDANGYCGYSPTDETIQDVFLERKYIKDTLDAMPLCKKGVEHEDCELIEVLSSSQDLRWQDAEEGSRIMIIESGKGRCRFQKEASEGRYKHRIAGRYSINNEGFYASCEAVALVPRGWARLMHERPGSYRYIPSKAIDAELEKDITNHFPDVRFPIEHGNPILSILADYNPQATFVLTEPPLEKMDVLCSENLDDIRNFYEKASNDLRRVVSLEGIKYINYSAGVTKEGIKNIFLIHCAPLELTKERYDLIMEVEHQWLRDMSSIPGVVFVQAGAILDDGSPLDGNPIDCISEGSPNRVRVVGFSDVRDFIGPNGVDFNAVFDSAYSRKRLSKECVDLFVNFGISLDQPDNDMVWVDGLRPVELSNYFYVYPIHHMMTGSSFAAPVALSYIINTVNRGGDLNDIPALLKKITSDGSLLMHDPVRNENLESFRLRKAWYWDRYPTVNP